MTDYSPAFLNFERDPVISGKIHKVNNRDNHVEFAARDRLVEHLDDVKGLFHNVKLRLDKAYKASADRYNLRKRPLVLEVSKIVWKRNYSLSNAAEYYAAKLAPKFEKCRVIRRVSTNIYEFTDIDCQNLGTWHIKNLKRDCTP